MTFRIRIVAPLASLLPIVLIGCSSSPSADGPAPVYLFTVESAASSITGETDALRLELPVDEVVTWFTDRPVRTAGDMTMRQLIDDWTADGFVEDPPNAALDVDAGGVSKTFVVELGVPTVEGDTVLFPLTDIPADGDAPVTHAGRTATHPITEGEMGRTGLFIDSVTTCTSCMVIVP